ncbi:deoxyribose-phosphate aldolase [Methanobrevibacter sp. UBA46]|jgi:deoxyribose-phosphate aldolase|uniref:deoxyribose-phosphate aldolase n=1 Tax=Methanobrevibacter sp. UBA46 TaxID=1915488 RepID=UPI002A0D296F|nr:deoxyribose-phosphate aldolase [Methanobacteriaceae archaeon]MDD4594448.1 deoxyribose-phosphate aldolase [Methanobacteriaceae archaeon]
MENNLLRLKTEDEIAKYIDYAFLDNTASIKEIDEFIETAKKYGFYAVVVGPTYIKYVSEKLKNENIKIVSVIDFPLGFGTTTSKVTEAKQAIINGADEIDMVANIPALKNKDYKLIQEDINAVKEAIGDHILKVIIELTLIDETEIKEISKTIEKTNADFIKTNTGFSGACKFNELVTYLTIIRKYAPSKQIKASGGINNFKTLNRVIAAGADRIGTSSGPKIIDQLKLSSSNTEKNAPGIFDKKPKYKN